MAASRYWPIVSFVAGELSPLLRGRFDLAQYRQGCERIENFHPMVHGGLMRRAGTQRMGNATTAGSRARLIPFLATDGRRFQVEVGALTVRIYNEDGLETAVDLSAPWSVFDGWLLDYSQAEDTLVLVHPSFAPYRLSRFEASSWALTPISFVPAPTSADEWYASTAFTPSSSSTGTITFTGPAYTADAGRVIRRGSGYGVISSVVGTTINVQVSRGFTASSEPFILEGSPIVPMTPSAAGPVGAVINVVGGFAWDTTAGNGRIMRINGGLLLLLANVDAVTMTAEVLAELDSTTTAPGGGWQMEYQAWSAYKGYPRAVTFHEQRLVFAGWKAEPQGIAASGIGLFYDFRRTTLATDAYSYRLAMKEAGKIEYLISDTDLVALTETAEIVLEATNETALSATNPPRPRRRSNYGCARVRPVEANGELLFVSKDERRILAMFYEADSRQYQIREISKLAEHMLREGGGVLDLAFARSPVPTIYVPLASGAMVCCTYDMTEGVVAWWRYVTAGGVESVSVCQSSLQDRLWMQTSRAIGRFIERADPYRYARKDDADASDEAGQIGLQVDCAEVSEALSQLTYAVANPASNGVSQRVVCDGYDAGDFVPSSNVVNLPAGKTRLRSAVGYAYTSLVRPMPPELATAQGTGMGRPVRKGPATVKVYRTLGGLMREAGSSAQFVLTPAVVFPDDSSNEALPFVTGEVDVDTSGWDEDKAPFEIVQDKAMPMTVISVTDVMSNSP